MNYPDLERRQYPALVRCLQEEPEMTRRNACYALNAVGTPAVDALRDAFERFA